MKFFFQSLISFCLKIYLVNFIIFLDKGKEKSVLHLFRKSEVIFLFSTFLSVVEFH